MDGCAAHGDASSFDWLETQKSLRVVMGWDLSGLWGEVNGIFWMAWGVERGLIERISGENPFEIAGSEGPLFVGFEAEFFGEGGFAEVDEGGGSGTVLFEVVAEFFEELGGFLGRLEANAVGGVGDDGVVVERGDVAKIAGGELDVFGTGECVDVGLGGVDGSGVDIAACDEVGGKRLGVLVELGFDLVPVGGVEVGEAEEAEFGAEGGGGRLCGEHGGFDEEGAGAAKGVVEWSFLVPFTDVEEGGGEVFLHGGGDALLSVSAFVEGAAAKIDADAGAVLVDIEVELEVGEAGVDVGAFAVVFAELVDDGVFEDLGGIGGVA